MGAGHAYLTSSHPSIHPSFVLTLTGYAEVGVVYVFDQVLDYGDQPGSIHPPTWERGRTGGGLDSRKNKTRKSKITTLEIWLLDR